MISLLRDAVHHGVAGDHARTLVQPRRIWAKLRLST